MKKLMVIIPLLLVCASVFPYELNTLINSPTAGILQRGEAEINAKIYKNNGLILGAKVGLFRRFMFGFSYGAEQIVGNQEPDWHERVEFNAKFRIFDETFTIPAIAIGYDSQGHGHYYGDVRRYDIKSKGFYLATSKNFAFMGNLGVHLGANYSLETEDKDEEISFFAGIDKSIGEMLVFICDYDVGWNDNDDWDEQSMDETIKGLGRGYFNASLDVHFTEHLVLKISLYDLLENRKDTIGSDRTISLLYYMTL